MCWGRLMQMASALTWTKNGVNLIELNFIRQYRPKIPLTVDRVYPRDTHTLVYKVDLVSLNLCNELMIYCAYTQLSMDVHWYKPLSSKTEA